MELAEIESIFGYDKPLRLSELPFINMNNVRLFYSLTPENCGFNFIALESLCYDLDSKEWEHRHCEVVIHGWAAFDGVRHLHFGSEETDNLGYFNYPNIPQLIKLISELNILQNKYCRDYGGTQ